MDIVRELIRNGRETFTEIGRRLHVTEGAIRKRVRRLENKGVILGYDVDVNPKRLGYEINALIGLDTEPEEYVRISKWLTRNKQILKLWRATGDHMFLFECWFKDRKELEVFITKLEKKKGITKVCPAILLDRIK